MHGIFRWRCWRPTACHAIIRTLWSGFAAIGICQGVFALFTMYLPPLFPTLLRTTGAGFCYNFGRIAAGIGTVFFGVFAVSDTRLSLLWAQLPVPPRGGHRTIDAGTVGRRTHSKRVTASCG